MEQIPRILQYHIEPGSPINTYIVIGIAALAVSIFMIRAILMIPRIVKGIQSQNDITASSMAKQLEILNKQAHLTEIILLKNGIQKVQIQSISSDEVLTVAYADWMHGEYDKQKYKVLNVV